MNEHNVALFFLILSSVLLLGAINRILFISKTKKTSGTIIEIKDHGGNDYRTVTVEYKTENGRIYQYTDKYEYTFLKRVGNRVNVYYDPRRPDKEVLLGSPILSFEMLFTSLALGCAIYFLIKLIKY